MLLQLNSRLPYNPQLQNRAKFGGKNMTRAEKRMRFDCLLPLQNLLSLRILRQRVIGNYIIDFYLPKNKLVIEIDGDTHFVDDAQKYDEKRTDFLKSLGLYVVRYTNDEVYNNLSAIYENLLQILTKS
ncbi:MAG: endonuclease domain-containing protein [bacterium]|nr:endonuclease domain-containing protein [bacterium]